MVLTNSSLKVQETWSSSFFFYFGFYFSSFQSKSAQLSEDVIKSPNQKQQIMDMVHKMSLKSRDEPPWCWHKQLTKILFTESRRAHRTGTELWCNIQTLKHWKIYFVGFAPIEAYFKARLTHHWKRIETKHRSGEWTVQKLLFWDAFTIFLLSL